MKSSSQSKLLILSGLVDAQISGNQSYPQTIAGLSKSWELYLLSGIPKEVKILIIVSQIRFLHIRIEAVSYTRICF